MSIHQFRAQTHSALPLPLTVFYSLRKNPPKLLALSPFSSRPLLPLSFSLYIFKTWAFELACDISKASCPHVDFADFPLKSACHSHLSRLLEKRRPEMRNKPQTCSSVRKISFNVTLRSVLLITHPQSINNWLADTLQLFLQLGITGPFRQITQSAR